MNDFITVARDAALKAGSILRENIDGNRDVSYKGDVNLVTEMDIRSERAIVETLLASFPLHGIIAEEETNIRNGSEFSWIIDPLDGTTNYAHGYPFFSVSIALEQSGDVILGVVYDPMRDELFMAQKGQGAFLNGRKIQVSVTNRLISSLLATGFPYDRKISQKNNLDYFPKLLMASQEVRRDGSAALDLCYVACGRLDGFWELKLKPWDVAAGSLIVHEAGGTVSDFSGSTFSIHKDEIVGSNDRIHSQLVEILRTTESHTVRNESSPQ
jgi:myo-inositol-1(or 4)-monophosphatase